MATDSPSAERQTQATGTGRPRQPRPSPLQACSNDELLADLRDFWASAASTSHDKEKKRKSPDELMLNGLPVDVTTLYREVCRLGGMSSSESAPQLCWKRIYDVMANASNTAGNPTAVSNNLHTFYTAHLLPYQQAHPEDVSELLCPLCRKSEAPAGAVTPCAGGLKWNQIWQECGNPDCGMWLHKVCTDAEGTTKRVLKAASPGVADGERLYTKLRFCHACFKEEDGAGEAEPPRRERPAVPLPACAPSAVAGAPRYVQLLPARPSMSGRVFRTHQARCVPPVESPERCDHLLRAARAMLCASGLTAELVAASLGFARDDMDVSYKTVALLVSGDAVLSALVFCEDAHGNAAQILVAGTAQQARRAGCMRQLLLESAEWLAGKGVHTLCVGTTRANTAAGEVYTKLGFQPSPNGQWPPGMVAKRTSSDLRCVWVLSRGQPAAAGGEKHVNPTPARGDGARRGRAADDSQPLPTSGPPAEWPGEVPFTSGCVWEGLPQALWPQVPCNDVVVKLITDPQHPCCGAYGLFARRALQPSGDLLAYGGTCRPASDSDSLFLSDCGGGLDVDAARCGSEARYLNDYSGIAARANAVMEAREAPLTGSRYVAVRLIAPVRAGEELLLDYGPEYPRHLFSRAAKRRKANPASAPPAPAAQAAPAAPAAPAAHAAPIADAAAEEWTRFDAETQ